MTSAARHWPKSRAHPTFWLATWFGSGLLPRAPGTWGSLAALPFAWVLIQYGGPYVLIIATLSVLILGTLVSEHYSRVTARSDPGEVVIDEVAGLWLTLLPVAHTIGWLELAIGFALFRLFDIWKPWPVSLADRQIKGGVGIMIDDVIAGLYAAFFMYLWSIRDVLF